MEISMYANVTHCGTYQSSQILKQKSTPYYEPICNILSFFSHPFHIHIYSYVNLLFAQPTYPSSMPTSQFRPSICLFVRPSIHRQTDLPTRRSMQPSIPSIDFWNVGFIKGRHGDRLVSTSASNSAEVQVLIPVCSLHVVGFLRVLPIQPTFQKHTWPVNRTR